MGSRYRIAWILFAALTAFNSTQATAQKKNSPNFGHVHALTMDSSGQTVFLGAHTGLFRSSDDGRSWSKVPVSNKHAHIDVMDIAPEPREPTTIYVATHEVGVLKSIDGGKTWREVNSGLKGLDVHGLAIDPKAPATLHAAVREKGDGLYRTTDGGSLKVGRPTLRHGRNFSLCGHVHGAATKSRLFLRVDVSGRSARQPNRVRLCRRSNQSQGYVRGHARRTLQKRGCWCKLEINWERAQEHDLGRCKSKKAN